MFVSARKLRRGDEDGAVNSIRKYDLFPLVLCLLPSSPPPLSLSFSLTTEIRPFCRFIHLSSPKDNSLMDRRLWNSFPFSSFFRPAISLVKTKRDATHRFCDSFIPRSFAFHVYLNLRDHRRQDADKVAWIFLELTDSFFSTECTARERALYLRYTGASVLQSQSMTTPFILPGAPRER